MREILLLAGGAEVAAEPGDSVLSAMLRARKFKRSARAKASAAPAEFWSTMNFSTA
jgi:hypothetical protein